MNPKFILLNLLVLGLLAMVLLFAAPVVYAAPLTITVDRFDDDASATACGVPLNDCSLRGAITKANGDITNTYTIFLPAGAYTLTIAGTGEDDNVNGDLDIKTSLVISGAGAGSTTIDGNWTVTDERVFHVIGAISVTVKAVTITGGIGDGAGIYNVGGVLMVNNIIITASGFSGGGGAINNSGGSAIITNSTFTNNSAGGGGGSLYNSATMIVMTSTISSSGASSGGGGIFNQGTLTLTNSTIAGNSAVGYGDGGGIFSTGTLNVTSSTIISNTTSHDGGGIANSGSMTIISSTIGMSAGVNSAGGDGGGIYNSGALTLTQSIVSNNSAGIGAGIYDLGSNVIIKNSTISANSTAGDGGGILATGTAMTITNVTISENTSGGSGGGIRRAGTTASVTLKNTLVANNPTGGNCSGTLVSSGNNLSGDGTCIDFTSGGDITDTIALLSPLGNYGGPTKTYGLLSGSPAINAGNDSGCPNIDQRGVSRPVGPQCDIGAFEGTLSRLFLPLILK